MKCDWCDRDCLEKDIKEVLVTRNYKTFYKWLCEECLEKYKREEIDIMEKNKYFIFLDQLRNSGETNMFGATPYIQARFGLLRKEAEAILLEWMETFDARCDNGHVSDKKLKVQTRTIIEFD
jgi:hypothetical protein